MKKRFLGYLGLVIVLGSGWVACQSPTQKMQQEQRSQLKNRQRKSDSVAATKLLHQLQVENLAYKDSISTDSLQGDSLRR